MKNLKKKAFTLVELLVVIAIIAILAVAGVVGYVVFTKKATESNDTSLIGDLNSYMAAAASVDDINTVSDARNVVLESGIELSTLKLNAKGYRASYDIAGKKFYKVKDKDLEAEGFNGNKKDLFVFVKSSSEAEQFANAGYSIYLQKGYNDSAISVSDVGVDVGVNAIATVNYTGTDANATAVIYTNSFDTVLNIDSVGSVKHYGDLGRLNVEKVAMSSYHESGKVRIAILKAGNLEVETEGSVSVISVTATNKNEVKVKVEGSVDTLASAVADFVATGTKAPETTTVSGDLTNALAIVDGTAVNSFANNKITSNTVLLKDYNGDTAIDVEGNVTITGNLTKFKLNIVSGNITLKNIYTTYVNFASNYTGSITFDGGVLDNGGRGTGDADAAVYVKTQCYATFKNMTIAASLTKGIKASSPKSIVIDNCVFDASNLTIAQAGSNSDLQSLSLVDIQMNNNVGTTITIKDSVFKGAPQGATSVPSFISASETLADSDTGAAIKIKAEGGHNLGAVTITGNRFVDNYRDIVVGTAAYADIFQGTSSRCPELLCNNNKITSWTISGNSTTLTNDVVSSRAVATLSHNAISGYNKYTTDAACCGEIKGGAAIWTIANCYVKEAGTWRYVKGGTTYSVTANANGSITLTPANA